MGISGQLRSRKSANEKALAAFGIDTSVSKSGVLTQVVRRGGPVTVLTIGYEKRDVVDLASTLRAIGVEYLADIRDKPVSRKPGFGASGLLELCREIDVEYGPWSSLGSTEAQRDRLHETGDLGRFRRIFRSYAEKHLNNEIEKLAKICRKKVTVLLCYERAHEECHRSIIADLLAEKTGAGITAVL